MTERSVKFVRIHGRVVPLKVNAKNSAHYKPKSGNTPVLYVKKISRSERFKGGFKFGAAAGALGGIIGTYKSPLKILIPTAVGAAIGAGAQLGLLSVAFGDKTRFALKHERIKKGGR